MFRIKYLYNLSRTNFFSKNLRAKFSSKAKPEDLISDEPIKYSTSPASKYKAETSRLGYTVTEERLWYEPSVLFGSVAIFLIYFTILREENDIDVELGRSLYSRIEGLEEHQLRLSLKYNEEKGLDTVDIIKRLEEIEKEKAQVSE